MTHWIVNPIALPVKADGSEMNTATWIADANGKRVCTMKVGPNDWGSAQQIERALNAYPKLVAALDKIWQSWPAHAGTEGKNAMADAMAGVAREALAELQRKS